MTLRNIFILSNLFLLLLLAPMISRAQFIRLALDIPAETGTAQTMPLELTLQPDPLTGRQTLMGTTIFCLSAAENLHVLVRLSASDSLINELQHKISFKASLAYSNSENPLPATDCPWPVACFPISNSGRLIENIKGYPAILKAHVFVTVRTDFPQYIATTYVGNIYLNIEYN